MSIATDVEAPNRAKRLKAASTAAHERVDSGVMQAAPFADGANYQRFLRFQYHLHRRVETLYADADMQELLPDLAERSRLAALEQDFADLGLALPEAPFGPELDRAEALGWLYVVEGSNMGAAILAKEAAKLGFTAEHGARHLAGHPEGRALHWRRFTAALNEAELTAEEETRLEAAANAAFSHVETLVGRELRK
ncbi:heme oxygenase [Ancylobacter aquaticus]|uniref:Heme oxygenase n=1 Tax=Ancylobacter aquaticus TaxID=100 RepID=A0A4R1I9R7_ANCAQ|nr:biliverdin-producing heme oxygenase [Ancylobacter aquaticus]TCK30675.1 heme oxygenase [Ancylobacter aquaticus]